MRPCRLCRSPFESFKAKGKRWPTPYCSLECQTAWAAKQRRKPTCHPERPHAAYGLCRTCATAKDRAEHPEKYKAYRKKAKRRKRLRTRYGMSLDDYMQRLADQGGCCAICRVPPAEGRFLCVDHCHKTTKVRGLLCHACNSGIGYLRDDVDRLRGAIAYLSMAADNRLGATFGS